MRLILMGTGPFAVPVFQALLESRHQVIALVTRPVPPAQGRRKGPANPVRDSFQDAGRPILVPPDVNEPSFCLQLADAKPDLLVVCDFGQILSDAALAAATLGGINLHASLLPKYRGAAPINWALWHGEPETGVTVIHMTARLDAGPCLTRAHTPIDVDEDAAQLEVRLARLGVDPVLQAIEMLAAWDGTTPLGTIQDPTDATRAPRLKKSDGKVDWSRSARAIANQVRALQPWPGTYTQWQREQSTLHLLLERVSVANDSPRPADVPPGRVLQTDAGNAWVATGSGTLALDRVKPAGKNVMDIREFLRGYPLKAGDQLGE